MKAIRWWRAVCVFLVVAVLGFAAVQWTRRLPERQWKVALSFALMSDLGEYLGENEGTMPLSWSAFAEWCQKTNRRPWQPTELERRYGLAWGVKLNADSSQVLITVADPELASIQAGLNDRLRRVGIGTLTSRSPKQQ